MAVVSYRIGVREFMVDSGVATLTSATAPSTRSFPCTLGLPQSLQKVLAQRTNTRDIEHFVQISLPTSPFESRLFGVISDKNFASLFIT